MRRRAVDSVARRRQRRRFRRPHARTRSARSPTPAACSTSTRTPVALDDAIASGHIAWQAPVDFRPDRVRAAPRHAIASTSPTIRSARGAVVRPRRPEPTAPPSTSRNGQEMESEARSLTPQRGNLLMIWMCFQRDRRGTIDVHGVGELDNLTNSVNITLDNGATTRHRFRRGHLHGKVDFTWSVASTRNTAAITSPSSTRATSRSLPFALTYPFLVGTDSVQAQITAGFAFRADVHQ